MKRFSALLPAGAIALVALLSCSQVPGDPELLKDPTFPSGTAAPAITLNPQPQSVTAGNSATFVIVATGTNLNYQWQRDTSNITGAVSASYTTPATTMADDSTTYRCIVSNSAGSVISNPAILIVVGQVVAPAITTHPQSQSVTAGQTATFTIVATGTDLTYQWQKGTTNVAGAVSAGYTTPATTMADDSATYRCVVTNSAGNVTSNPALLIVAPQTVAPGITTHPRSQSVTAGQTATFSIVSTGTDLRYQWQKDTVNIAGATLASYTTPATTTADDSATYRCIVSNGAGTVTSNPALLTVVAQVIAPAITTHPQPQAVTAGQSATFSVVATGTNLVYQWQKGTTNIAGATLASYTTPATTMADDSTTYRCVVTNTAGTATSNPALLIVAAQVVAPAITTNPLSQSVTAGQTATFSVAATGTNLAYQWQRGSANIAGATLASYTTSATTVADDSATYRCVVTNSAGTATSNPALLTVAAQVVAPTITTQPQPQSVTVGQTATFTVVATGTNLTYQWFNGAASIAGATLASFTTPVTVITDNGSSYKCIVSNSAGTASSSAVTLTVSDVAPQITYQPQPASVNQGQKATFEVGATGTSLKFQWQKGSVDIAGANSSSYATPATTAQDNGATFECVVSNSAGTVTSNTATLSVLSPPTITQEPPATLTAISGQTVTLSVRAAGTGVNYQWYKDGSSVAGATQNDYVISGVTAAYNGSAFYCEVSNAAGAVAGSNVTLNVTGTTMTDIDGNVYNTLIIGKQEWMSANLKTTRYNDGTAIPLVTLDTAWDTLMNFPGYCWVNNDSTANKATYGALYDGYVVVTGKLAPTGWHVPSSDEWETLLAYLGGDAVAGGKLKESGTARWAPPNTGGTDAVGFSALPAGMRGAPWVTVDSTAFFWTTSTWTAQSTYSYELKYGVSNAALSALNNGYGLSVRCIRN